MVMGKLTIKKPIEINRSVITMYLSEKYQRMVTETFSVEQDLATYYNIYFVQFSDT